EKARPRIEELGMTNVILKEGNVTEDLRLDRQFDLVTCRNGFSVIPNWAGAYENIIRYLKIGGSVIVYDVSFREGWRSAFNPLLTWGTKQFGGTTEGLGNFKRVADRLQSDGRFGDVKVTLNGHSGVVRATRR